MLLAYLLYAVAVVLILAACWRDAARADAAEDELARRRRERDEGGHWP